MLPRTYHHHLGLCQFLLWVVGGNSFDRRFQTHEGRHHNMVYTGICYLFSRRRCNLIPGNGTALYWYRPHEEFVQLVVCRVAPPMTPVLCPCSPPVTPRVRLTCQSQYVMPRASDTVATVWGAWRWQCHVHRESVRHAVVCTPHSRKETGAESTSTGASKAQHAISIRVWLRKAR